MMQQFIDAVASRTAKRSVRTVTRLPPAAALVLLAIFASGMSVRVPTFEAEASAQQPEAPAPAYSVGAAFDRSRGRLVLFGGYMRGSYPDGTWEWDGRAWTRFAATGPSPRNSPALEYDASRKVVVLFGGDTRQTGVLGDTWAWDGKTWRQLATTGPARTTHPMVYDSKRGRLVLFGGSDGPKVFGDTWEWDGEKWTQMSGDGPPARTLHGMAYDEARGRVVMWGGTAELRPDAPSFDDTWEWDGRKWERIDAAGPSARDHIAMSYDAERRVVVMHGGGIPPEVRGETWLYDGKRWTRATAEGPTRRYARLMFDSVAKAMLLYGGFDMAPSNELWRFDGKTWALAGR